MCWRTHRVGGVRSRRTDRRGRNCVHSRCAGSLRGWSDNCWSDNGRSDHGRSDNLHRCNCGRNCSCIHRRCGDNLRRCADGRRRCSRGGSRCDGRLRNCGAERGNRRSSTCIRCDGSFRGRAVSRNRCGGNHSAVLGDHIQFGNGKAVIGSGGTGATSFLPDEAYVMAQMLLEINAARSDLENAAGAVFDKRVITIRAAQAALNVALLWIAARRGSLCKPQRDQQGRYNDQQQCSLHGILRRFSPCGGLKFRLGFDTASDSDVEPSGLSGSGVRTCSIQVKPHNPNQ